MQKMQKMKKLTKINRILISCLIIPILAGCALMNTSPGDGQKPDWDKLAPTIQSRTKYVAAFAFTMKQVQPHKNQICDIAANISNMLDNYDDKDASFETVRAAVMNIVSQIENPALRNGSAILVDMVLTEAFNYAWKHYENMINLDKVRTSVLVAQSVGAGLREACQMFVSTMNTNQDQYVQNIFTVPRK